MKGHVVTAVIVGCLVGVVFIVAFGLWCFFTDANLADGLGVLETP